MAANYKLLVAEKAERDRLIALLATRAGALEDAVREHNAKLAELWAPVAAALEAYNETIRDAESFRETIADDRRGSWDDASESWQEGDRGQEVDGWISEWEQASFTETEIEEPSGIDEPDDLEAGDTLGELPEGV